MTSSMRGARSASAMASEVMWRPRLWQENEGEGKVEACEGGIHSPLLAQSCEPRGNSHGRASRSPGAHGWWCALVEETGPEVRTLGLVRLSGRKQAPRFGHLD